MFPTERDALFQYDVIVFGEVPPEALADYELGWIREFVERRGGGLILLDGLRGDLHRQNSETFGPLVPVSGLPGDLDTMPTRIQFDSRGIESQCADAAIDTSGE